MIIWRMRIACYIPKTTNTHSEYVTLIVYPWQQRLRESVSVLRLSCYNRGGVYLLRGTN